MSEAPQNPLLGAPSVASCGDIVARGFLAGLEQLEQGDLVKARELLDASTDKGVHCVTAIVLCHFVCR